MKPTKQDTFLERWAGPKKQETPKEAQRRAYQKLGIDPRKAARRWS